MGTLFLVPACQVMVMMVTVPMQNAQYVAGGRAEDWRHYALNIPVYTHFTSPIRRYADVMVHRLLTASLEGPESLGKSYPVGVIASIAAHCNDKKLAAKEAQQRSDEVKRCVAYLAGSTIPSGGIEMMCPPHSIPVDCGPRTT